MEIGKDVTQFDEGIFRELALYQMPEGDAHIIRAFGEILYGYGVTHDTRSRRSDPINRGELKAILADLSYLLDYLKLIENHGGESASEERLARLAGTLHVKLEEITTGLRRGLGLGRRRTPRVTPPDHEPLSGRDDE